MNRQTLQQGHDWVLSRFHSRGAIARRLFQELGCLRPPTVLGVLAPLNLSYRRRLRGIGMLRVPADAFNCVAWLTREPLWALPVVHSKGSL